MRAALVATILALLAACGPSADIQTPSSLGPDLARIQVVRVETRVAQNADIRWPEASSRVVTEVRQGSIPDSPVYLTDREREGRVRTHLADLVNGLTVDALRGLPSGDLPVVAEVVVTRFRIRGLLRGALLGSDHKADATLTLRSSGTGQAVSEPLNISTESTEQLYIFGGLQLRAVRPEPADRLAANLAYEVRLALDRVARKN